MIPPADFAQHRDWSVPRFPLDDFTALRTAWSFSKNRLWEISHCLAKASLPPCIVTVGIAGSLARMEATRDSDCDLVVVLDGDTAPDSVSGRRAFAAVWQALQELDLESPEESGIYAGPVSVSQLLDPTTIGRVAEDQRVFGSRFLFLMELQPVWGAQAFQNLAGRIVKRYATSYVALDPTKQWTYLLNDLVRYFKSLCQTYLFGELYDDQRWRLRNLKARHSRLLIYAGLLFLIGESSRFPSDREQWLTDCLTWTPLERLAACYATHHDDGFQTIAGCLDRFVARMNTPGFRESLRETSVPDSPLARESNPHYTDLKRSADDFLAELLRFALSRRGDWSERFFEYWLF